VPFLGLVPVDVELGLDAAARQDAETGLFDDAVCRNTGHLGDRVHHDGHRSTDEIPAILDPSGSPEGRRVQRGLELLPPEAAGLLRQLHRPVDQAPIEVRCHEAATKTNQASLPERSLLIAQNPQDELPQQVRLGLDDRVPVAGPRVGLEQRDHRQERRRDWLLAARLVGRRQLVLELVREQLRADLPQEPEEAAPTPQPANQPLLPRIQLCIDFPAHVPSDRGDGRSRSRRDRQVDRLEAGRPLPCGRRPATKAGSRL